MVIHRSGNPHVRNAWSAAGLPARASAGSSAEFARTACDGKTHQTNTAASRHAHPESKASCAVKKTLRQRLENMYSPQGTGHPRQQHQGNPGPAVRTHNPARPLWFRTLRFSSFPSRYALTIVPSELLSAYSVRKFGNGTAVRLLSRLLLSRRIRSRGIETSGSNSLSRLPSTQRGKKRVSMSPLSLSARPCPLRPRGKPISRPSN